MLSLCKPHPSTVRSFLETQETLRFAYDGVGSTSSPGLPSGYVVDRTRVLVGEGESAFRAARTALECWEHFRLGWLQVCSPPKRLAPGAVVAVIARASGIWWLNACRIVYVADDDGPSRRFGFAYGTLPGHAESGEERFLIEWDRSSDRVTYDILAFSRPNHFMVWIGYPLARRLQRRFARDSGAALVRAVRQRLDGCR
ncbi:MAG: DUF1990 domain-containing protein [Planctomycetota bacterium]|nr:MAG: DUF1990 domain-containing protein [Planctomycetota bacterium]